MGFRSSALQQSDVLSGCGSRIKTKCQKSETQAAGCQEADAEHRNWNKVPAGIKDAAGRTKNQAQTGYAPKERGRKGTEIRVKTAKAKRKAQGTLKVFLGEPPVCEGS